MDFFSIQNIAVKLYDYPISYVELIGTLFGLISVYYASRANILTWSTGIVNIILLFILFFQVQLYADMFLQIYFFIITFYGWHNWSNRKDDVEISRSSNKVVLSAFVIAGTLIFGYVFKNINSYLPEYFKVAAAYPFADSFVMVSSIVATILLAKKKLESWYLWISLDAVCVFIYFKKCVYFLSFEYLIFFGLAIYGLNNWKNICEKHSS